MNKFKLKYTPSEAKEVESIRKELKEMYEKNKRRKARLRELGDKARARMSKEEIDAFNKNAAQKRAATRKKNQAKKARK